MTTPVASTPEAPETCPDCDGERQVLTAHVVGRGLRRRTVEQYAACLACDGTGHTPNGGATS